MSGAAGRRETVRIVLGGIAILTIAVAAATLASPETFLSEGTGGGTFIEPPADESPGPNPDAGGEFVADQAQTFPRLSTCVELLNSPFALLAILGGIALITYGTYRRYGASIGLLVGYVFLPPSLVGYFMATNCGSVGGSGTGVFESGVANSANGIVSPSSVPPWAMASLFAVAVAGVAYVVWSTTSGSELDATVRSEDAEEAVELEDLAEAAGRAAERIERHNADINNAVYEAWYEMTSMIEVENRETLTSGEFADVAVEAGMDRDDVTELAWLFDEVRYGGIDPDEERESRAIEILRHIEAEYGSTAPVTPEEGTDSTDADASEGEGS